VKMLGYLDQLKIGPRTGPAVVTEYINGLTLDTHLYPHKFFKDTNRDAVRSAFTLTPADKYIIARDVARGLAYLHDKNVQHQDAKPNNILIVQGSHEQGGAFVQVAKLIDVGIARAVDPRPGRAIMATSARGFPDYMSPEQLDAENQARDTCWDVYTYAVVVNEMVGEAEPWGDLRGKYELLKRKVQEGERPQMTIHGQRLQKLVRECWSPQKTNRPPMDEVVRRLEQLADNASDEFARSIKAVS